MQTVCGHCNRIVTDSLSNIIELSYAFCLKKSNAQPGYTGGQYEYVCTSIGLLGS